MGCRLLGGFLGFGLIWVVPVRPVVVYDGDARIHRRIAAFTLSRDHDRYERLLDALTLYRLTLVQPRQENMLRLMRQNGVDNRDVKESGTDLRAPAFSCREDASSRTT